MRLFNFQRLAPLADRSRSLRPPLASHKSIFDIFFTAAVFFEKSCNFFCCFFSFAAQPHRYLVSASAPPFSRVCENWLRDFPRWGVASWMNESALRKHAVELVNWKIFPPILKGLFSRVRLPESHTSHPQLLFSFSFFLLSCVLVIRPLIHDFTNRVSILEVYTGMVEEDVCGVWVSYKRSFSSPPPFFTFVGVVFVARKTVRKFSWQKKKGRCSCIRLFRPGCLFFFLLQYRIVSPFGCPPSKWSYSVFGSGFASEVIPAQLPSINDCNVCRFLVCCFVCLFLLHGVGTRPEYSQYGAGVGFLAFFLVFTAVGPCTRVYLSNWKCENW